MPSRSAVNNAMKKENKKLGLVQSRGIGDICIALPIAKHYKDQGYEILWPICEEFWPSFKHTVPWVQWIPIPTDKRGEFFYSEPAKRLTALGCTEHLCLYQSLNVVPELANVPWFQIQKFDEFKYTKAGVPFIKKWTLGDCIVRDANREQVLYDRLVERGLYYVTHTEGSSYSTEPDLSAIPKDWQRISITEAETDCIFDWLRIIEGAQALIAIDSVIANLVDQLQLDVDKYWIPRSHIHLTPVLGSTWTILEPPTDSIAAQKIFKSG
jgi:hypothetical protein